ncbi:MAG: hypothetical protein O7G30_04130 [Proteobacteria bacterium]|nr:hypothetical protein [Pseudomonadota bacterium]
MSPGSGPLEDRRQALEEQFFQKENERLRDALREKQESEEGRAALAMACGISNDAVLDALEKIGIDAGAMAAFVLVPLVAVAWANGDLEEAERRAVLDAAAETGVERGSDAFGLLEGWLEHAPSPSLLRAWLDYTRSLSAELDTARRQALKAELVGRAKQVAEAAGGFLGLTSKTSKKEQEVLDQIEGAFS